MRRDTTDRRRRGGPSRRRLLELFALAGSGLLAGCGGDSGDSGGPADTTTTTDRGIDPVITERTTRDGTRTSATSTTDPADLEHVSQEFKTHIDRPMTEIEKVNFFHLDTHGFYRWEHLTNEIPVYGPWVHSDFLGIGDMNLRMYEDVVSEPGRIEVTVRDDVNWSDGSPITGRDVVIEPLVQRLTSGMNTFDEVAQDGPARIVEAITGYDYDGKTGTLYSDFDGFGQFVEQSVWLEVLVEHAPRYPTNQDPWKRFADRIFEVMDRVAADDFDPWSADEPALDGEIKDALFGSDRESIHRKYRDPENVVNNGAWTLKEIQGQQAMLLEPNEEHRHADLINYDQVRIEYGGATDVVWTNLNVGRYDMALAAPPSHVAENLPDKYDTYFAPDDNGVSLVCNGKDEFVGNTRVRQAISAALDTVDICEQVHPRIWAPIQTPCDDTFAKPDFLDQSWFDENLQSFAQDHEFAAELMREAGYERNSGGTWVDGGGDPASLELAVPGGGAPQFEQLVVHQLNEFGINAEVLPLENTLYSSEFADGGLQMYSGNGNAGSAYTSCTQWAFMASDRDYMRGYGWFDQSLQAAIHEIEWTEQGYHVNMSPETVDHLTVQAPEVGDFWAENGLREYEPVRLSVLLESRHSDTYRDVWPELIWLSNWYQPGIPVAIQYKQFFRNTKNWLWNDGHSMWDHAGVTTRMMPENAFGMGDQVFADPENPK